MLPIVKASCEQDEWPAAVALRDEQSKEAREAELVTEQRPLELAYALTQQLAARIPENTDCMFVEADLDFHLALAEGTENPFIPILMDSIIDLLRAQRKRIGFTKGGLQRGQIHHKKILEAITRRDPQAARQAMQDHLQQVREDSEASTTDVD